MVFDIDVRLVPSPSDRSSYRTYVTSKSIVDFNLSGTLMFNSDEQSIGGGLFQVALQANKFPL